MTTATLPLLREELELLAGPVLHDGQPSWTLHDPVRSQFFRIDWPTFEILSRWSLNDPVALVHSIREHTTLQAVVADVERVVRFLGDNQLLQPAGTDSAQRMAARWQALRGSRWTWLLHHYLFFRVPLWRPDAWLARWLPLARVFQSSGFLVLTLVALLAGGVLVMRNADAFAATFVNLFNLEGLMAYGVALFAVKWLHELGHAFTAKGLGCRVPTMGVAFLVMWPMAYTDTNDTWRLTSHRHRLRVAVAGIATELIIAVWATLAWALVPDGGVRDALFVLATTSWVATLAINASPFMRFDGYFILCDLLDMPNLHPRSFALARWRLRESLFGLGDPKPEQLPPRTEAWLIAFAWATWLYRFIVFIGIALLVYHLFFKLLGAFLFVVELAWFIALPVLRELSVWRERWPDIRATRRGRGRLGRALLLLLLLTALLWVPLPGRVHLSAMLRPAQVWPMFTPGPAMVAELSMREGQVVPAGHPLLALQAPDIQNKVAVAQARVATLRWFAANNSLSDEGRENWRLSQEESRSADAELAAALEAQAQYRFAAPLGGVVRDVDPDVLPGQWVKGKTPMGVVVGPGEMVVETYLEEEDVKRLQVGGRGLFLLDGGHPKAVEVSVMQIDEDASRHLPLGPLDAAAGGHVLTRQKSGQRSPERAIYRALLKVDEAPAELHGRTWRGRLVIHAQPQSLAWRYVRQGIAVFVRESGL